MTIVERVLQQLVLLLPGPSFTGLNPRRGSVIWQGKLSDGICIRNTLIDLVCTFNYSYYSCSIYLEMSHNTTLLARFFDSSLLVKPSGRDE